MYCTSCGKPIPDTAAFCPECGARNLAFAARNTAESAPVVSINGIPLKHYGEIDPYENICGGVSNDHQRKGYFMIGCATADLPETFTLSVTWQGETVEIPLKRSDVRLEKDAEKAVPYYREIFGY